MFSAISVDPPAASWTDRDISLVVAVCSSTALAMVSWKSLIEPMISLIRPIASTAPEVSAWMASTRRAMSSVARAVSWASSLTSLATTAKPLPASPARAASMVAFSASRLVCSAIPLISLMTVAISSEESPSLPTVALVASADGAGPDGEIPAGNLGEDLPHVLHRTAHAAGDEQTDGQGDDDGYQDGDEGQRAGRLVGVACLTGGVHGRCGGC